MTEGSREISGFVLMHPVNSHSLSHAGYHHEAAALFVQFVHTPGTATVFFDVPVEVWQDFMKSDDKLRYYNTYLRDLYVSDGVEMQRRLPRGE